MSEPVRILVVDHEPMVQRVIARALSAEGFEVECHHDGKAALEWAVDADPPFDLVITNGRLPHMLGDELVLRLRERFPRLPVIHTSGDGGQFRWQFPDDVPWVAKPFAVEELVGKVRQLLGTARGERDQTDAVAPRVP